MGQGFKTLRLTHPVAAIKNRDALRELEPPESDRIVTDYQNRHQRRTLIGEIGRIYRCDSQTVKIAFSGHNDPSLIVYTNPKSSLSLSRQWLFELCSFGAKVVGVLGDGAACPVVETFSVLGAHL